MKVKLTIMKTILEERIIEMDEKFRACAVPIDKIDDVPEELWDEAAEAASAIAGLSLACDDKGDLEEGVICNGICMDNNELIFEI